MSPQKILKVILINLALSFLITYLSFAFISWNFNVTIWNKSNIISILILVIFSTVVASTILLNNNQENK